MVVFRSIWIVIYLLLVIGQEVGVDRTVCVPEMIYAHFVFGNINEEQLGIAEELTKKISDGLANGSNFSISVVGKDYKRIGNFKSPVPLDIFQSMTNGIKNYAKEREVSVDALFQATLASFPFDQYETTAVILIMIVGNTTVLPKKPETLDKKKTFLIGIGEPVKQNFSEMATGQNHLFWLNTTGNLSDVSTAISAQICEDSKYPCDVDMYKPATSGEGRARCKNCSLICTEAKLESGTCKACPYYRIKHSAETNSEFPVKVDTHKKISTIAVAVVIAVVIAVGIVAFCLCCIREGEQRYQAIRQDMIAQGLGI